jgi:ABC-2 type transport system permease protein
MNVVRAELATLARRRVLVTMALATAAFAVVTTLATFLSAEPAPGPPQGRGATLESLAEPGGGTEAFSLGIGFVGLLVLVTFIARLAGEFSHGTLRTMLIKEPRRLRVVLGKFIALGGGRPPSTRTRHPTLLSPLRGWPVARRTGLVRAKR